MPAPPTPSDFSLQVEAVEQELANCFRQATTFKLYQPSETLPKRTQLEYRRKYTKQLFKWQPSLFSRDLQELCDK